MAWENNWCAHRIKARYSRLWKEKINDVIGQCFVADFLDDVFKCRVLEGNGGATKHLTKRGEKVTNIQQQSSSVAAGLASIHFSSVNKSFKLR